MFLWKNAIVLTALLGLASLPVLALARASWERHYTARLIVAGMLVACLAVSAVPMAGTQLIFGLLLILCFDRRVPMAATYLFFFFWAPSAGSLLGFAGAYIAPLTPFLSFSGALLAGYLLHPQNHLRRRLDASDACLFGFLLLYCLCVSLRGTPTGIARNIVTYLIPYALSYQLLSRLRIPRPELVLRLLVFAAAAAGLLCIFETVRHWPLYAGIEGVKGDLWTIDAPRVWLERGGIHRAYGPYAHPLTGGAMLGLAGVALWGLIHLRGMSVALLALGLAILLGLFATLSRSGMVALAVGIVVFQVLRGRYALATIVIIVTAAALISLPILGGEEARSSTFYRLSLLTGVPRALGGHVWLGYREAIDTGLLDAFIQGQGIVDMVNAYLAIVVQGGVVSLIPYVLLLVSTYPHYRALRRAGPDKAQLLLAQCCVSLQAAIMVSAALLSAWTAPMQLSFVVLAILVALRTQVVRARAMPRATAARLVAVPDPDLLPVLR